VNEPAQISNVDNACAVIKDWFGWQHDISGPPIVLPFAVPEAINTVNRRIGRLWLPDATSSGYPKIFDSQDTVIPPLRYQAQPDGIVPMIWENQSVWGCGFKPETGTQLWVTGDWPDEPKNAGGWRPTRDVVDTAIIFVLLANTMWASADCVMDKEDHAPAQVDRLLFTFAPWAGFAGFWTNSDRSLLRMQGSRWGVTACR
jgi:hypothetical protein